MFDGAPYYAENLVCPRATWFSDSAYARHVHATSPCARVSDWRPHHPTATTAGGRGSTPNTQCAGPGPRGKTATMNSISCTPAAPPARATLVSLTTPRGVTAWLAR